MLTLILIAILVAIIINKGLRGIEYKQIHHFYLLLLGFALQLFIFNERFANSNYNKLTPVIYIISLAILLLFMFLNIRYSGIKIAMLGFLGNCIAIVANGGYMPQDLNKLEFVGNYQKAELLRKFGHFYNGVAMTADTKFNILSDIVAVRKPEFLASVYSIGDVFITIGLIIFIFEILKRPKYDEDMDDEF